MSSMSPEKPLLRIGVIADPQYADVDPRPDFDRFYRNSPQKLAEAIETFNAEDLAFVVTLGDLIDRGWDNFDTILSGYDGLRHENVLLPGNHDFSVAEERLTDVHARLNMPAPWHHFLRGGIRFIVIDGNEMSVFSTPDGDPRNTEARARLATLEKAGAINAMPWNGGLGDGQFQWLEQTLSDARERGEKVVVMGHYPLYPANTHNLWDCERVIDLFDRSGNVIAYLNGHNHVGNLGRHGSTWYVNFKGMVDTEAQNTFAVVEFYPDRIEVIGHGREESRSLPL